MNFSRLPIVHSRLIVISTLLMFILLVSCQNHPEDTPSDSLDDHQDDGEGEVVAGVRTSYEGPLPPDALVRLGKGSINVLDFSIDGEFIAAGGAVGLSVYDAETLNGVWQLPGSGEVISLAYSPDGEILAAGTTNSAITLVDASNGQILQGTQGADDDNGLNALAWSEGIAAQDGLLLAAGFNDGNVIVSRVSKSEQQGKREIEVQGALQRHPTGVTTMAYNPNGKVLATGDRTGGVNLWDAETLQWFGALEGHDKSDAILDLVWSPDSERLVSAGEEGTLIQWNILNFEPLLTIAAHDADVIAAVYSPAGDEFASASNDGQLFVWNADEPEQNQPLDLNTEPLASIAWSPEWDRFATASPEGELKVWSMAETEDAVEPQQTLIGHNMDSDWVTAGKWSPDGERLAAGKGHDILIWDLLSYEPERTLQGHTSLVTDVAYSPNGKRLASGSRDKSIIVWDLESGDPLLTLDEHSGAVSDLDWSPDGRWLASAGSLDDSAIIWDPSTGEAVHTLPGDESGVWSVAWSPDSETLATGTTSGEILIWEFDEEMAAGPANSMPRHLNWISALSWSPDGEWLLSGGADNRIVLTNMMDETTRTYIGHLQPIRDVEFSPDGDRIASASRDGLIIVWQAGPDATTEPQQIFKGHTDFVNSVSWSPDGTQLASGSDDGTVIVWGVNP